MTSTFQSMLLASETAEEKGEVVKRLIESGTSDTARALARKVDDLIDYLQNRMSPTIAEFADYLRDLGEAYRT